jgi:hypothetical protein
VLPFPETVPNLLCHFKGSLHPAEFQKRQFGHIWASDVHGGYTGVAGAYLGLLFFMEDSTLVSSVDLALWLLTTLVDGFVVYLFVLQGLFRRFVFLSLYFLLSVSISIAWCVTLCHFRFSSIEDGYFFFITYALSSVFLLLSVIELTLRITRTNMLRWKIIMWAGGILLAMACFGVASLTHTRVTMSFLVESSQNVLLMCGFAVELLWAWKLFKNPLDRVAARFVSVLGVYFLLFFLDYWATEISSRFNVVDLYNLPWMMSAWLPLGCGFTLVSQEQSMRR